VRSGSSGNAETPLEWEPRVQIALRREMFAKSLRRLVLKEGICGGPQPAKFGVRLGAGLKVRTRLPSVLKRPFRQSPLYNPISALESTSAMPSVDVLHAVRNLAEHRDDGPARIVPAAHASSPDDAAR
jgi:hypothetical protein